MQRGTEFRPTRSGSFRSEPTTLCMKVDPEAHASAPTQTRLARLLGLYTEAWAWRTSASGERITGLWLGRLPEGWFVFHDVPVGARAANIDHVVIGPGGVFTINTKNLTGAIRVNRRSIVHDGFRTDFLPKATAEAHRAARLLSAAVGRPVEGRGVLAILADEWIVNRLPEDVYVGGPRSAKHWMLQQPSVLRSSDVIVLAAAASKPETWVEAPTLTLVPKTPTASSDRRVSKDRRVPRVTHAGDTDRRPDRVLGSVTTR
jgi:Nuclease-related domain